MDPLGDRGEEEDKEVSSELGALLGEVFERTEVLGGGGRLKKVDSTNVRYCTQVWKVKALARHRVAKLFSTMVLRTRVLMVLATEMPSKPLMDPMRRNTADVPSKIAVAPVSCRKAASKMRENISVTNPSKTCCAAVSETEAVWPPAEICSMDPWEEGEIGEGLGGSVRAPEAGLRRETAGVLLAEIEM